MLFSWLFASSFLFFSPPLAKDTLPEWLSPYGKEVLTRNGPRTSPRESSVSGGTHQNDATVVPFNVAMAVEGTGGCSITDIPVLIKTSSSGLGLHHNRIVPGQAIRGAANKNSISKGRCDVESKGRDLPDVVSRIIGNGRIADPIIRTS